MSESLRDQLLKAGFKPRNPSPAASRKGPRRDGGPVAPAAGKSGAPARARGARNRGRKGKPADGEIGLAQAWAMRERTEREERDAARREQEEKARVRKQRRQQLGSLLAGKALNADEADLARHFPHGSRIRRIHVTPEQLPQLNEGRLAVVQHAGRYLLVTRETAEAAATIDPEALVLLCEPAGDGSDDGVPDDLVW